MAHQQPASKPVTAPQPGKAPRPADNPRRTGQTRKLLGKHYAAKYGKRRGG